VILVAVFLSVPSELAPELLYVVHHWLSTDSRK